MEKFRLAPEVRAYVREHQRARRAKLKVKEVTPQESTSLTCKTPLRGASHGNT